jgi:hypothetical protein
VVHAVVLIAALAGAEAPAPEDTAPAPAPPAPERWGLMRALQGTYPGWLLDGGRLSVSGWVEASFTASSDAHQQLPMGFDYLANEAQVQQAWLRVERAVDQNATTPTFGFRSDTLFGIDYRFTVARGLFDGQLTADHRQPNLYGVDPVQFYAEAYFPQVGRGLDVKVGRFFALFGEESIDTTENDSLSRSYAFIYDPFTHTGVVTTLNLTEAWSVQNGVVAGSDVFINPAASPTYIGSVKWAPPDGPDSVLFSVVLGSGRFNQPRDFNNVEIFDLVWTHKHDSRLTYVLELLYGVEANVPAVGTADWFAAVQYLTYELTPRLKAAARLEFFDDVQGQRTGFAGLYTALTVGLVWGPTPEGAPAGSLVVRPEVRYDYNNESRPFEGKHGLLTAAVDVVLRF